MRRHDTRASPHPVGGVVSASADWYPDPAEPGRLRYWDGSSWSAWVSEDGQTRSAPVNPLSYPPPAPDQVGEIAGAGSRRSRARAAGAPSKDADILTRVGIGIAAVSGVVATSALGRVFVSQEPGPFADGADLVIDVEPGVWIAAFAAVVLAVAAALPMPWARLTGVGVAGALAITLGLSVLTTRLSDRFDTGGPDVELGAGGWILVAATVVGFIGMVVSLVGVAWIARGRPLPSGSGAGVASLVLAIVGVLLPMVQAIAIAFGLLGTGGMRGGAPSSQARGLALAGFIVGVAGAALWWLIVLIAMFVAQPG